MAFFASGITMETSHDIAKGRVLTLGFKVTELSVLSETFDQLKWTVTALCGDHESVRNAKDLQPHLALFDVEGVKLYGPGIVSDFKTLLPDTALVCLGRHIPRELENQLYLAGASLVLRKPQDPNELKCCNLDQASKLLLETCGAADFVKIQIARKKHSRRVHN